MRQALSRAGHLLFALALTSSISACRPSGNDALPASVREAALDQALTFYTVQALRLGAHDEVPGIRIVRAWKGKKASAPSAGTGEPEAWCLELSVVGMRGGAPTEETEVWIVAKNPGQTEWGAGLVAAMSSLWPHEACGQMPWLTPNGAR